ncbi:MAG TPA: septum formation initiator family protein [Micromonosporaceae bacterium]|nr:septum formation initiator family protein [Micromonosporaceae bacterium]
MSQRRTPSGQGPARRPSERSRGSARTAGPDLVFGGAPRRAPAAPRRADSLRSANRPAAARRAAAGGAAKRTSAPQPRRLSGRAITLVAVLIALALAYTYPVRDYLSQQSEIARMEAAQAAQRAHIEKLSEQAELWKDPEYIKIQARQRFYMVKPGEKPLIVLFDPDGAARDAGVDPRAAKTQAPDPWYGTLWSSIEAANQKQVGS